MQAWLYWMSLLFCCIFYEWTSEIHRAIISTIYFGCSNNWILTGDGPQIWKLFLSNSTGGKSMKPMIDIWPPYYATHVKYTGRQNKWTMRSKWYEVWSIAATIFSTWKTVWVSIKRRRHELDHVENQNKRLSLLFGLSRSVLWVLWYGDRFIADYKYRPITILCVYELCRANRLGWCWCFFIAT